LAAVLLGGCAGPAPQPLTIAAAASLAPVFDGLAPELERQLGAPVTFSYGSTANLAEQIRNGAPFDVLAAADAEHVDQLIAEGLLEAGSRSVFANGRLVLAWPTDSTIELRSLEDLLGPAVGYVALANPEFAPYGRAARQALERSSLWMELQPRLIYAESIRDAGQLVISGNADAGLLAASTAISLGLPSLEVPARLFDPIVHVAAARTQGENHQAALEFLDFLHSAQSAAALQSFGLSPLDG
jgi:molybdate transport system substrate-binding protein